MLPDGDEFFISAFWDLNTCRSAGWSIGPIPWTSIHEYARFFGLDEELIPLFIGVIRGLDEVYLEYARKKVSNG